MTSAFFGLDIAARALRASQTRVDITNQNIANANTPGYSRQLATVAATTPFPIPVYSSSIGAGQLGTGVAVTSINRARNTFVDYQMRNQLTTQGQVDAHRDALIQVEAIVNEPSPTGLNANLTKYWAAWQEVANSPSDSAVRANLLEQGKAVADAFSSQITQFKQQQRDIDGQVGLTIVNVNNLAGQIADLNVQISQVEVAGMHANDLRDQRDQLTDSLSKLVKINAVESADGQVLINVGNRQLVDRNVVHPIVANTTIGAFTAPQWSDGSAVNLGGGKLQGLIDSRDTLLQSRIDSVNALASRVIESVNSVHVAGVGLDGTGGRAFFTGTDASTIAVDSTLLAVGGTSKVAAGRMYPDAAAVGGFSFAAGDSSNAIALAQLQNLTAQRVTGAGGLVPGQAVGPSTLIGLDLSGAAPNKTYTFSVVAGLPPTVTVSPAGSSPVKISIAADTALPPNGIITVDFGSSRLTLRAPNGTALDTALLGLNGTTVSTMSGPSTVGDQYARQIAALGAEAQTANGQSNNQDVLITQLQNQRSQTSGVSLDEETINLMMYQKAYQASARVITVVDSMLDTLINNTGRVGR